MIRGRRFLAALAATILLPLVALPPAATAGTKPPVPVLGTVYVFRPMGGKMATPEMDNIAAKIRERGLAAGVYNYVDWIRPANEAIARYKAETWKSPIIVIGHSAGGDSAIRFSSWLNRSGVPVDLVITLDPTRIAGRVPRNVGRFINVYSSMNTLGGGDPKPAADFHGHFASVDLKNVPNLIHRYLPRTPGLQERVVEKIAAVAEDPPPAEAATVPIEYPIPEGEPIVLFDAGVKVPVKPGDTATTIAGRYGVPDWAVAELNHVKPGQALIAGREVVVPRDLDSVARQAN